MSHRKRRDPKVVEIGIASPYDFFCQIVQPNLNRFHSDPSLITAINAAWPLWHLCDWYYWQCHPSEDKKFRTFAEERIDECSELGLFRDIANAAKHSRLTWSNPRVDAIAFRKYVRGALGTDALGAVALGGEVATELSIDVAGVSHDLRFAIAVVSRFWLGKVLPHCVEAPIAPDNLARAESMRDWCRARLGDEGSPRWKWAELQSANAPHYIQRLAFLKADDKAAFRSHFQV